MSISNIGNNSASSETTSIEEDSSTDESNNNEDVEIIDDCIKLLLELKGTREGTQGSTRGSTEGSTGRSTGRSTDGATRRSTDGSTRITDQEADSHGHALLADLGLISQEELNDLESAQASISSGERGSFQRVVREAGQRSLERAVEGDKY